MLCSRENWGLLGRSPFSVVSSHACLESGCTPTHCGCAEFCTWGLVKATRSGGHGHDGGHLLCCSRALLLLTYSLRCPSTLNKHKFELLQNFKAVKPDHYTRGKALASTRRCVRTGHSFQTSTGVDCWLCLLSPLGNPKTQLLWEDLRGCDSWYRSPPPRISVELVLRAGYRPETAFGDELALPTRSFFPQHYKLLEDRVIIIAPFIMQGRPCCGLSHDAINFLGIKIQQSVAVIVIAVTVLLIKAFRL